MKTYFDSQSGNALWFVLLAVALLGFLTALVSRTSSSVEQSGSVEQARIKATSVMRFSQSVATAIEQMMLNGVSENELDFKAIDPAVYDNPSCTKDYCEVFGQGGGGISYRPANEVLGIGQFLEHWIISGNNRVYQSGCDEPTSECSELLMLLPNIPDQVCLQINALQDVKNPSEKPPQQNGIMLSPAYIGRFSRDTPNSIGGLNATNESPELRGKAAGCMFDFGTTKTNVFFQILIAR